MVSLGDVYNQLITANSNLTQIHGDVVNEISATNKVTDAVEHLENIIISGFTNISDGLNTIIELQDYSNKVLYHITEQNETIICNLDKISRQTCELVSESHLQSGYQKQIYLGMAMMLELYKTDHAEAYLEFERSQLLEKKILKCCPQKEPEPACQYRPCDNPGKIEEPPHPDYRPYKQSDYK
jgi:hypothetical protein